MCVVTLMPIRSDSLPFVFPLAIVTATLVAIGSGVALLSGALTVLVAAFFRDPERISNAPDGVILSPADGRVLSVRDHDDGTSAITIFLSVLDVHVARSPVAGRLTRLIPRGGGFAAAFSDKADKNARVELEIRTADGPIGVTLFAGLVARRVLPWVAAPTELRRGQRIAIIRFGSRSRVTLPPAYVATVKAGSRVQAGASPIATRRTEQSNR
jgi:phosphatidylserine decarboxylase